MVWSGQQWDGATWAGGPVSGGPVGPPIPPAEGQIMLGYQIVPDTGSQQAIPNGSYVALTNDGLGAGAQNTLPGGISIWDTGTNQFDFSGLTPLIHEVRIQINVNVITAFNGTQLNTLYRMRIGGTEQLSQFDPPAYDGGAGVFQQRPPEAIIPMTDADLVARPATFEVQADVDGTRIEVRNFIITVLRSE